MKLPTVTHFPSTSAKSVAQPVILGFDPGRYKCGLAIVGVDRTLHCHQVVEAETAVEQVQKLRQDYPISLIVMGDQTGSQLWKQRLANLQDAPSIILVDERNSSLEARDRYWEMFPPKGLGGLIPKELRPIPRPIDDIVAILLIERYLSRLVQTL
ncbi:MAG: resolvase [Cyanobacteria bacterium J06628_6]